MLAVIHSVAAIAISLFVYSVHHDGSSLISTSDILHLYFCH